MQTQRQRQTTQIPTQITQNSLAMQISKNNEEMPIQTQMETATQMSVVCQMLEQSIHQQMALKHNLNKIPQITLNVFAKVKKNNHISKYHKTKKKQTKNIICCVTTAVCVFCET